MICIPTDCWNWELAWDYAHISATRKLMKTYVHNFYWRRKHQFAEHFLWMYTRFYIIFKRKTHFKARNQKNAFRQFNRLAFASQDPGSHPYSAALVRDLGRMMEDVQHSYRAAIQRFSEDFINSLTKEKESVTVGRSVSFWLKWLTGDMREWQRKGLPCTSEIPTCQAPGFVSLRDEL